ncbi:hypothetical protein HED50_12480 [Ochrobactrum oryzae]|nr:hypothetical protein [Brucella oryzae]
MSGLQPFPPKAYFQYRVMAITNPRSGIRLDIGWFLFANNIWFLPWVAFPVSDVHAFESVINIYTTQIIPRRDLSFFESRRVLFPASHI